MQLEISHVNRSCTQILLIENLKVNKLIRQIDNPKKNFICRVTQISEF